MKSLWLLLCVFMLAACSDSGSSATTTYKYQVSGASALALSEVAPLASSFVLKWNEDDAGNITGVYTNSSTGESLSVTGTSNGSGRTISATRAVAISGVLSFEFTIAQTGDLNGTINATLATYDGNNVLIQSQSVTVTAETTGGTDGGGNDDGDDGEDDGDDGGGAEPLASYGGLYTGSVVEASNTAVTPNVGNGKYCDMTFAGSEFKFEFNANYLTMGYSAVYSSGGGAYADVQSGADPANINVNKTLGAYSPATLMDAGHDYTGLKITNGDISKLVNIAFAGAFSGTSTKKFNGTMTLSFDGTPVCSFTLDLTKQ